MLLVTTTALAVGGATMLGSLLGYRFRGLSHRFSDIILAFAAGVMLCAAILGLILPAVSYGGSWGIPIALVGIFAGAVTVSAADRLIPHVHRLIGKDIEAHRNTKEMNRLILFVFAIAIHNLPEGLAAGVSFGTGNTSEALLIAGGIALQNIPEGAVTIAPMLTAGINPGKALRISVLTGVIEIFGTIVGYLAVMAVSPILPFALAFAGGTMLYVVSDEMIPETHDNGNEKVSTYALLVGFCVMMISDVLFG